LPPSDNPASEQIPSADRDLLSRAEQLVYDCQRRRLDDTYADIQDTDDIRELFHELLYPPPEERIKFIPRNNYVRRIARNWLFRITFHRMTVEVLEKAIELERINESVNGRIARALRDRGPLPDSLEDGAYIDIARAVSSRAERLRQLENVIFVLKYADVFVKYFRIGIKDILRMIPRPLIRNSDLLHLGVEGYTRLKNHENELLNLIEIIRERESARIDTVYGGPEETGTKKH
jgi:hypothetical protein